MNILVVDDSRAMRMIVIRTLRQAGYDDATFTEASNGLEALEKARKIFPDLVLSDWNMPEMNGIQLTTHLTQEQPDLKIGLITTESTDDMRQTAREAGAKFLVTKPLTASTLKEALGLALA